MRPPVGKKPKTAKRTGKLARSQGNKNTPAKCEMREREVDAIVAKFRDGIQLDAPSPWKVIDDMYDDNGLPR